MFSKYSCFPLLGTIPGLFAVASSNKSVNDKLPFSNSLPFPLSKEA